MIMVQWRIYYSDNTTHDNTQGPPPSRRGVEVIVQKNSETLWHTETGGDYYLWREWGLWQSADHDGLVTEAIKRGLLRPKIGIYHEVYMAGGWITVDATGLSAWIEAQEWILQGETISSERFGEIFRDAQAAADFGRREAYLPGERRPTQ